MACPLETVGCVSEIVASLRSRDPGAQATGFFLYAMGSGRELVLELGLLERHRELMLAIVVDLGRDDAPFVVFTPSV